MLGFDIVFSLPLLSRLSLPPLVFTHKVFMFEMLMQIYSKAVLLQ